MKLHLSLKSKLLILAVIPFIAFAYQGTKASLANFQELEIMKSQNASIMFIKDSFALIHAVQAERGTSSAFVGGGANITKVEEVRNITDQALLKLQSGKHLSFLSPQSLELLTHLPRELDNNRKRVNTGNIAYAGVIESFSNIVNDLFSITGEITARKTAGGIGKRFVSLMILAKAQEGAGRFRGYASGVLSAGTPININLLFIFISDYETIIQSLDSPGLVLSDESKKDIATLWSSVSWLYVKDTLQEIINNGMQGNYRHSYEEFWENATEVVEHISKISAREIATTEAFNQEILDGLRAALRSTLISFFVPLVLIILLTIVFIRAITGPLNRMGSLLSGMAEGDGDLSVTLPKVGNDEIAELSGNFNSFILSLNNLIRDVVFEVRNLEAISSDLAGSMEQTAAAETEISTILASMEKQVAVQSSTVGQSMEVLRSFLQSLTNLHREIESQAAAVTQSSASIEELLASIHSEQVITEKTSDQISKLVRASRDGRENLNQVTTEIDTIAKQSEQLADANTLIYNIASQTNLLAMNAAIEAAHAGEAGRGFAVVADEIRKLAENASNQSKSISQNLKSIQSRIDTSVVSARSTEESFRVMNDLIENVNQLQNQVMSSVAEQDAGSSEIRVALTSINEITQNVQDASSTMEHRSSEILSDFQRLQEISSSVAGGMTEITTGIGEIDSAVMSVREQSIQNQESIRKVEELTGRFKLKS